MPSKTRLISQAFSTGGALASVAKSGETPKLETGEVTVTDVASLPTTGNKVGDQAFVTGSTRLYLWNGSGWYSIALINNTPTWDSGSQPSSSYVLDADSPQDATVITLAASDPEGLPITFSHVIGGSMDSMATIGVDSSVFTITPKTRAQVGADEATGTITFRATDGINILPQVSSFTLTFISEVVNSRYTSLLMSANAAGTNSTFTDSNTQVTAKTITASGDPTQGSFSPYRSGGYSVEFDGTDDGLQMHSQGIANFGNSDLTAECWFKTDDIGNYRNIMGTRVNSGDSTAWSIAFDATGKIYVYSNAFIVSSGTGVISPNTWYYVSYSRDGSNHRLHLGTSTVSQVATATTARNYAADNFAIGKHAYSSSEYFNGKIKDVRITKGLARYSASSYTAPTSPLTSDSNTTLLACSLPYIADASGTPKTITVLSSPKTVASGPYDYTESNVTNGGNIHFDGNDYLALPNSSDFTFDGDFTAECWAYIAPQSANYAALLGFSSDGEGVGWNIFASGSSLLKFHFNVAMQYTDTTTLVPHNTWCHLALVRYGTGSSNCKLYINGVADATTRTTNATATCPQNPALGATPSNTSTIVRHVSNTKITDVRIVKGTALYTSNFIPPTQPLTAVTNTKILVKGQGSKVFDKSQTANLTLVGNTIASTTQVKFSNTKSVYFDGTGGVLCAGSKINTSATASWTAEAWVYLTGSISTERQIIAQFTGGSSRFLIGTNNSKFRFFNAGSTIFSTNNISQNTWIHVAATYDSSTAQLYVDGIRQGTVSYSRGVDDTDLQIGARYLTATPSGQWQGYIQDVRISNGLVRYTTADESSNIPTAPLEG